MKNVLVLILLSLTLIAKAQMDMPSELPDIGERYDRLTLQWLEKAEELQSYKGLTRFCKDPAYRSETMLTLGLIHHYDSLVLQTLMDPTMETGLSHHEFRSTLHDLQQFEEKYSTQAFIEHLKNSCGMYHELEKEKSDLKGNSGMYSYDGQVLLIESDLQKYLKHISKRMLTIDKHVHLLDVHEIDSYPTY